MRNLTDDELRAIAYYAVGVASEGKDVAYALSFCGDALTGPRGEAQLRPFGNSGYTVGEMQTDLGARPDVALALVNNFNTWARTQRPEWAMPEAEVTRAATELGRDGRHIRDADYKAHNEAYGKAHHGRDIPS